MIQVWIRTNPPVLGSYSRPCPASQTTTSEPTLPGTPPRSQGQARKELNNILIGW